MLPLQITLEGFLSYREKTTISFEGASLWMLAGENGAGKSSVFDAMRWTLFGAHRGGKSGQEALIHHGREKLRVAFDLALGESRFRLIRTLARAGRSTWQIEEIFGGETCKIPETDGRDGYEKWVRERIGLSDETFCTAMYLAQNRGDAILSASPQARYEMLAEIVDISAYAALHERAKTRAAEFEAASRAAENVWRLAPGADPETLAAVSEKLRESGEKIERNSARREQILGLAPLCAQWKNWEFERDQAQNALLAAQTLLGDAAQIERDAARSRELEALLPPLQRYLEARERAAQNRREIEIGVATLETARARRETLQLREKSAQGELAGLESARHESESARLAAMTGIAELAPRLAVGRQIALYRAEIAALEAGLDAFPADLESQISVLEARMARAESEVAALAILLRLSREKVAYHHARNREIALRSALESGKEALPNLESQAQIRADELDGARQDQTRAVEVLAAAKARRSDAQIARERFESVQQQPQCSFCGQKLTPEHRHKERIRVENALQLALSDEISAQNALESATQRAGRAQEELESAQSAARNAANALDNGARELQVAQNEAATARARAREIFEELSPPWQARFERAQPDAPPLPDGPEPPLDSLAASRREMGADTDSTFQAVRFSNALEGDFPAPDDLQSLRDQVPWLENARLELASMAARQGERRELAFRLSDRRNQLAPLHQAAQNEDLEALFERETGLQSALAAAGKALEAGQIGLQGAREAVALSQSETAAAVADLAALELELSALGAARIEIARAVGGLETGALGSFAGLDEAALGGKTRAMRAEFDTLSRGDLAARLAGLRAAQGRAAGLESEVARLERALESVPVEARRAPESLQREAAGLKAALDSDFEVQKALQLDKNRLEERREERARLEEAHLDAQNRARAHKTLADLLGPHELQRFLLREAEAGIIDEANAVLDRISGGELRLELRADDEEIAGARKGIPKVLDVTIFRGGDTQIGRGQGMLPAFLSGSQRFRVAVALALGIGRFATRGGGSRLEAVIIDEGFGALDKIGRGEMIEELQGLGQELQRVILVSHQEEFFEAFPNRYWIEKVNGASTARLMAA